MSISRVALVCLVATVCASGSRADTFPSKPLRIVTAEPGGGSDFVSRIVGQGISGPLGQQVVIENHGGGAIIPETAEATPADRMLELEQTKTIRESAKPLLPVGRPETERFFLCRRAGRAPARRPSGSYEGAHL